MKERRREKTEKKFILHQHGMTGEYLYIKKKTILTGQLVTWAINRALLTPLVPAFNKPWAIYTQPAKEIGADLNCPYISTSIINDTRKYGLLFQKYSPV